MTYTARSVTAAVAPWTLTIGTRHYLARPVSASLVLRVLPDLARVSTHQRALEDTLSAAFVAPQQSWWNRIYRGRCVVSRDILSLDPDVQGQILSRVFAVPGVSDEDETDPEKILIAAHRRLSHPQESHRGPSLALAALTCEVRLGASWYFNPDRWPTSDGYAPHASVWMAYRGLLAIDAQDKLRMAHAYRIATSPDPKRDVASLGKQAFPDDPTTRMTIS